MSQLHVRSTPLEKHDVIAYVCPGCERAFGRAVIAASDTLDPLALRAHEGILLDHVVQYRHGPILAVDLFTEQIIGTIPQTPRLQ